MFQFYANFEDNRIESDLPTNKIYEDLFENGISYLKIDVKELGAGFFKRMHNADRKEMKKKHKRSVVRKSMIANALIKKNG